MSMRWLINGSFGRSKAQSVGYRFIAVMSADNSKERAVMMRFFSADVVLGSTHSHTDLSTADDTYFWGKHSAEMESSDAAKW
jgi:cysteine synthase